MVSHSHLLKIFPEFVVIHTVKSINVVNEAEVDVFLEFPFFLYNPMNVGSLIYVILSFLNPTYTSERSQFTYS